MRGFRVLACSLNLNVSVQSRTIEPAKRRLPEGKMEMEIEKFHIDDDVELNPEKIREIIFPLPDNTRPEDVMIFVEDDIVVVSDSHGSLYGLNPETGEMEQWYSAYCTGNGGFWDDLVGHQCDDPACDCYR